MQHGKAPSLCMFMYIIMYMYIFIIYISFSLSLSLSLSDSKSKYKNIGQLWSIYGQIPRHFMWTKLPLCFQTMFIMFNCPVPPPERSIPKLKSEARHSAIQLVAPI